MVYKIAIANEKGGVAKTTSAVSIGGALSELGKKVLLIDLDPQANLTLALGITPKDVGESISAVLLNSLNAAEVIQETSVKNLSIIPSNSDMGLAERFLPVRQNHDTVLRNALAHINTFDYIIFDCPPALGAITLNGLTAADLLLLPTQAEYFSAYALKNMMTAIRQVRGQSNPNLIYRVFVTMFDKRNRTHKALLQQLKVTFGEYGLLNTLIEMDTKLRESPIMGVPIMNYISNSRSAEQYRQLVKEIIKDVEQTKQKEVAHTA